MNHAQSPAASGYFNTLLGPIPAEWSVKRFKYLCTRYADYGLNATAESYTRSGIRFLRTSDIDDQGSVTADGVYLPDEVVGTCQLVDGDILISRSGTIGRSFLYSAAEHGACSFAGYLVRYRSGPDLLPKFAFYYTKSIPYAAWLSRTVISATIGNVNGQKFANMTLPVPSLDEQRAIVRFLDTKTAEIDALIAKKQRLLELLAEQRLAIITKAVTKGLDPKAPLKPTGLPWLGDVPAHWVVKRLRFCSDVIDCKHVTPTYVSDGLPIISTTEVKPYEITFNENRQVSEADFERMTEGGRDPRVGDIIYSRNASLGSAARVSGDKRFCLGQDLCIIRPHEISSEFLEHYLCSRATFAQIQQLMMGSTFTRINVEQIRDFWIALPPGGEQAQIADQLTSARNQIGRAETVSRSALERLREYRSALITAAVTGQIDVRGWESRKVAA